MSIAEEDLAEAWTGSTFHIAATENGRQRPSPDAVAKWFMEGDRFLTPDTDKKRDLLMYREDRGIWQDADALVRNTIRQLATFNVTRYFVEEVLAGIRESSLMRKADGDYLRWEDLDRTPGIVVRNGVLDPWGPSLAPFDPDRLDTDRDEGVKRHRGEKANEER